MMQNISSYAENCHAEVGVPRGPFSPEGGGGGASYSGVCSGGGGDNLLRDRPRVLCAVRLQNAVLNKAMYTHDWPSS